MKNIFLNFISSVFIVHGMTFLLQYILSWKVFHYFQYIHAFFDPKFLVDGGFMYIEVRIYFYIVCLIGFHPSFYVYTNPVLPCITFVMSSGRHQKS